MTTPPESALAAVLAEHEHEYERRCYPAHACSCGEWDGAFDDDGGPDDGQNDNADAYRLHVAAAILAATDARTEADGLTEGEAVVMLLDAEAVGLTRFQATMAAKILLSAATARIAHLEAALAAAEARLGSVEVVVQWAHVLDDAGSADLYDTEEEARQMVDLCGGGLDRIESTTIIPFALTTTQPPP